jgi:hypothetical protein
LVSFLPAGRWFGDPAKVVTHFTAEWPGDVVKRFRNIRSLVGQPGKTLIRAVEDPELM